MTQFMRAAAGCLMLGGLMLGSLAIAEAQSPRRAACVQKCANRLAECKISKRVARLPRKIRGDYCARAETQCLRRCRG